mmetsp:Transcript_12043/g.18075  ORF Transcript_12043/g.18075 Transcript_12043/m.18075 type:complete len:614 (+) Transcript_12043:2-1843(+)
MMQKYQLGEVIGKGTYGKAYRAERRSDGTVCIIKNIDVSDMSVEEGRRVEQEAQLLEKLRHPHIVAHLETFTHNRRNVCIVMEYCANGDLEQLIKRQRGRLLNRTTILALFSQLCLALEHVHANRIVHRDLKPANLLLSASNNLKLGDFGISTELQRSGQLAKTTIGTPIYMAPELLLEKSYDYKVDLWSTGCVLYEICRLKKAFFARSIASLVHLVLHGSPPELESLSSDFRTLVSDLLAKDPERRPDISQVLSLPYVATAAKQYYHSVCCVNQQQNSNDDDDRNYLHLGKGWWKKRDPASGYWFYVNEVSGQSQWEVPACFENETDRARRVRDTVRARVLAEREKRIRIMSQPQQCNHIIPAKEATVTNYVPNDENISTNTVDEQSEEAPIAIVKNGDNQKEPSVDNEATVEEEIFLSDKKDALDKGPASWLGDLEERMQKLQTQLQQLPRKESKQNAAIVPVKKDDGAAQPKPTKRELERVQLKRRIAAGRAAVRKNTTPEIEIVLPSGPAPQPTRPKSCSLYEYLLQKQGSETPLLKPRQEDDLSTLLSKLQQKVEKQHDLTVHIQAIRQTLGQESSNSKLEQSLRQLKTHDDDDDDDEVFFGLYWYTY